ncbi:hypothetical protein J2Z26_002708 [Bacillus luteolus]|nr:hypothetical protein [Cytobacillus luteolus]
MTPAGSRGKFETPQVRRAEEARIPPRGKQVPAAQRNGPFQSEKYLIKSFFSLDFNHKTQFPDINLYCHSKKFRVGTERRNRLWHQIINRAYDFL